MCGIKSKLLPVLLLVLLFLYLPLFSDVVLTEAEYQELLKLQEKQETILIQQKETIKSLESELTAAKSLQKTSSETIQMLSLQIDALNKYLETRKGDQILSNLKWFSAGFLSGNVTGIPAGIKIGLKF